MCRGFQNGTRSVPTTLRGRLKPTSSCLSATSCPEDSHRPRAELIHLTALIPAAGFGRVGGVEDQFPDLLRLVFRQAERLRLVVAVEKQHERIAGDRPAAFIDIRNHVARPPHSEASQQSLKIPLTRQPVQSATVSLDVIQVTQPV